MSREDYENKPRVVRTVLRTEIVQVQATPQSDDPPGRSAYTYKNVVLASSEQLIADADIANQVEKLKGA